MKIIEVVRKSDGKLMKEYDDIEDLTDHQLEQKIKGIVNWYDEKHFILRFVNKRPVPKRSVPNTFQNGEGI